jgi:hypothetical protein
MSEEVVHVLGTSVVVHKPRAVDRATVAPVHFALNLQQKSESVVNERSTARVHLSAQQARTVAERAPQGAGYTAEDARILADHILDAALCGYEYSGLPKILNIVEHPKAAQPRSPMQTLRETSLSILFDGGNQNGMLTMYHATRAAIGKANQYGMALVGVTNSWNSGRSAYFVEMIARADLVGIHTVSAAAQVAPPGGTKAVLGTNPIAFGFPSTGDPLIVDLGTAAFMFSDVLLRERMGMLLPEGTASTHSVSRRVSLHRRAKVRCWRLASTRASHCRWRCRPLACSPAPVLISTRTMAIC